MFKGKYDTLTSHEIMIADQHRTLQYKSAIDSCVEKGDVVIDLGSGSGILSIFAARAGAAKVYSLERNSQVAKWQQENIRANHLENTIEIVQGTADDFLKLYGSQHIDTVISECIGDHVFENNGVVQFLELCEHFGVHKKIPTEFSIGLYPGIVKKKPNKLQETLSLLETHGINFNWDSAFLEEKILDIAYFNSYDSSKDLYFFLPEEFPKTNSDIQFSFRNLKTLEQQQDINGNLSNYTDFPQEEGFLMLYFDINLYNEIYMTNHPCRDSCYSHSYYQRLIKKQGSRGYIKIDPEYDKINIEDEPCENIWIEYV